MKLKNWSLTGLGCLLWFPPIWGVILFSFVGGIVMGIVILILSGA